VQLGVRRLGGYSVVDDSVFTSNRIKGGIAMGLRSILSITVLGFVLAAGCARKPDDTAVVTNIKAQMFSDPQLKDANLKVTAKNGQVTLTGTVSSDAARLDAYKIATQTAGVSKVNDEMTVAAAQTAQVEMPQSSEPPQTQSEPPQAEVTPVPAPKKPTPEPRRRERVKSQERQAAEAALIACADRLIRLNELVSGGR